MNYFAMSDFHFNRIHQYSDWRESYFLKERNVAIMRGIMGRSEL